MEDLSVKKAADASTSNEIVVRAKFNSELIKAGFSAMEKASMELVFNEDHVQEISDFLAKLRKLETRVDSVHKEGKEKALKECNLWDRTKRFFLDDKIGAVKKSVYPRYVKLCKDIKDKEELLQKEAQRRSDTIRYIEDKVVQFVSQIAGTEDIDSLISVERFINLEKTRKDRYYNDELMAYAKDKYEILTSALTTQKENIRKMNALLQKKDNVETNEELDIILEQEEVIKNNISSNINNVQADIAEEMVSSGYAVTPEYIPTTVKARRTTWKFELVDTDKAFKKSPELLDISLNNEKTKAVLATLKSTGVLDEKDEYILNGVRYFEEKTF